MNAFFHRASLWIFTALFLVIPSPMFAQLNRHLITAGREIKTAGEDSAISFPSLIGKWINVLLSVLGLVFVVLVVYAGYLWMTAAGDTKKVETAKALLGQAVIGLVIIVSAYLISDFVITRISEGLVSDLQ